MRSAIDAPAVREARVAERVLVLIQSNS